uniref:BCAS3 domain-containing protein n=1 Tax=Globodera rostochiensis TaxID=31243 RepID=A0A914HCD9_GLORO
MQTDVDSKAKKEIDQLKNEAPEEKLQQISNGMGNRQIQGQPVVKQTITKFVSEVIPQTTRANSNTQNEQVNWAKVQLSQSEITGSIYVIIIGLARGYQVFLLMEDGNFEEVISVRNAPLKIGHLLPFKAKSKDTDSFFGQRPLIALYAIENGSRLYTVDILSLKTGKMVHHINFTKPVLEIASSNNCLLILVEEAITVYEHDNLAQRCSIKIAPTPCASYLPSFSLSENLLAIEDLKLNIPLQSVGGFDLSSDGLSANSQMINTAKTLTKAVTSISESIVSSLSSANNTTANKKTTNNNKLCGAGIVSVLNINGRTKKAPRDNNEVLGPCECVAHFCAHSDGPIGHLMFGVGGHLLLSSSANATLFNVFLLHLHPNSSSLSSVQHIYTLNRGNTAARVIESAFSYDNRWLTISTNHGTTHLFALNPYGGPTTARTHGGKFMNREGRFEKSAGIRVVESVLGVKNSNRVKKARIHPGINNNLTLARTAANASLFLCRAPILLNSVAMLKQRIFSTENLCAWASDNTPSLLQTSKRRKSANCASVREFGHILSAKFSNFDGFPSKVQHPSAVASLLVMNNEAVLTDYAIRVEDSVGGEPSTLLGKQSGSASHIPSTGISSAPESASDKKPMDDLTTVANCVRKPDQFKVKLCPTLQWRLTRSRNIADFELVDPPLPLSSPLVQLCTSKQTSQSHRPRHSWLPFLEVVTYTGPHRRLWLGPQFSFSVYAASRERSSAELSVAQLVGMQKCCPVLIEKSSLYNVMAQKSPDLSSSAARVICGSWSSDFDVNEELSLVKDKIEDAMKETREQLRQEDKRPFLLEEEEGNEEGEDGVDVLTNDGKRLDKALSFEEDDDDDACLMLSGIDL